MWEFRYAPESIAAAILPPRLTSIFNKITESGEMDNYLFYGDAGCGKTTVAKLIPTALGVDNMFVNGSLDRSIDMIRNDMPRFITNMSLTNTKTYNIIIIDEGDGLSNDAEMALKAFIERYHEFTRFIITTNHKARFDKATLSRFQQIDFNLKGDAEKIHVIKALFHRLSELLDEQNVQYEKDMLLRIVREGVPDIRSVMKRVGLSIINGKLTYMSIDEHINEVCGYIKSKDFNKMRKWCAENYGVNFSLTVKLLYGKLLPSVKDSDKATFILTLNEHDFRSKFGVDSEINLSALLSVLGSVDYVK